MFGFGVWEIAIIVGVVLVVLGPTFIPRLGRRMGDMVIGFRKAADQLNESMTSELPDEKNANDGKPRLGDGANDGANASTPEAQRDDHEEERRDPPRASGA